MKRKYNLASVKQLAKSRGGKFLSKTDNIIVKNYYEWECSEGHEFSKRLEEVDAGGWCRDCSTGLYERICRAFFESIFKARFPNVRNLEWLKNNGGIKSIEDKNIYKAELLYNEIDSNELFVGFANKEDRSFMNVTFNLKDENHKEHFDKLCVEANINGVNGHRSVGGYRASIYNALDISSVKVLIEVMNELKRKI